MPGEATQGISIAKVLPENRESSKPVFTREKRNEQEIQTVSHTVVLMT